MNRKLRNQFSGFTVISAFLGLAWCTAWSVACNEPITGCTKDTDCAAGRVCKTGDRCVDASTTTGIAGAGGMGGMGASGTGTNTGAAGGGPSSGAGGIGSSTGAGGEGAAAPGCPNGIGFEAIEKILNPQQ